VNYRSFLFYLFLFQFLIQSDSECPGQNLLPLPTSPGDTGPWPVGSHEIWNITLAVRNISAEIFYPGVIGSDKGLKTNIYDLRSYLPPNEEFLIPDNDAPYQYSNTTYNLPLDAFHGPYPVIIFIHGFSGWKGQTLHQVEHWASRGFVVVCANYPGIYLRDVLLESELKPVPSADQYNDTINILNAITTLSNPDLAFLKGNLDLNRLSIIGHSAGAMATERFGDYAPVLIPMAGNGFVNGGKKVISLLLLGATNDTITGGAPTQESSYNRSHLTLPNSIKRLSVLLYSGHLFCTDLCWIKADEGGLVGVAQKYGIWQAFLPSFIQLGTDGCQFANPAFLPPEEPWFFTNYLTAAVLEETQMCDATMKNKIINFTQTYKYNYEYEQDPTTSS